ncbi:MAG: amidohydrolase family protein, partial [Desulfobacteraceae bacterium]|nr:amidohydrolase family protein [Desulfobacteraceae bacterium]
MLKPGLPHYDNQEQDRLPKSLGSVIDAHVHIFPDNLFAAVWSWFDEHAWPIRYRMESGHLISFLLDRGLDHIVLLQYAHKPGISEALNDYMAKMCNKFLGKVTGMATVFPGEKGAQQILEKAFAKGLGGVKFHAHVQCFDMNYHNMDVIYDICERLQKPIVMHVGREPKSKEYACDPYEICNAAKLEAVLKNFPKLKICVPHLGFDEICEYKDLIEKYDTLWLDTAMVLTDYFPMGNRIGLDHYRVDRMMYGSDFP